MDASISCNRSGSKRVIDEIGGDFEVADCERSDFDGGVCGKRRVRVFDTVNGGLRACQGVVEEEKGGLGRGSVVTNLFSDVSKMGRNEVEGAEDGDGVMESEKAGQVFCGLEGKKELSFDLNVSIFDEAEFVGSPVGVRENAGATPVIPKECMDVIDISSDESEDEGEDLVVVGDYKGKEKQIEKGASYGSNLGLDLNLKNIDEVDQDAGGNMDGGRRYTREEKGKAKVVQSWISLGRNSMELDLNNDLENHMQPAASAFDLQLPDIPQQSEVAELEFFSLRRDFELQLRSEQEARELELRRELNARVIEQRRELARIAVEQRQMEIEYRKRVHRRFARPLEKDGHRESSENEQKPPFTARYIHREQKLKRSDQPLIRWKPSENRDNIMAKRFVPSLLDLSLKVLADNADAVVSLEAVPDSLKQRLSNLLCDSRKMNVKVLDLFVRGSPEEIRMKDTSWITDNQFKKLFGSFDSKNLRVFQFDLCGQCVSDDIIAETLARSLSSLPGLGIISLRGACRISDEALKVLVKLAPALCSINLGECSLLTDVGINYLANALGTSLKELFIDNCSRIDARHIAPALKKFEHLEVLSVAGIPNVSDGVISDIITACGRNIKDLDLADCEGLTDSSLKIIGQTCSDLRALNIVNLHNLTNAGLTNLANGCKSIRRLKLGRNEFSDEAIAAFIDIAGRSLEEFSLNHVNQVGSCTALSLAKFSRKLTSLDLSWCRKVTDEALGLIVDSCWSLKLLKLFGCTQITNVFLDGHSNLLVKIIGLNMTSILEHAGVLEAKEVYLRYSPLPIPCGSEKLGHQEV